MKSSSLQSISKLIAETAIEIMENPDVLEKAKEEHKSATEGGYVCPYSKNN